jgi:transposase
MIKYKVTLTQEEREELSRITSKGSHKSQKILNALILLNCEVGEHQENKLTNEKIAEVLNISTKKIDRVKKRFVEEGLDIALNGHKGTRVYKKKVDGEVEAHLVALCCSEPPEGFSRWSLRLLADKAVELEYVDSISHETVRRLLKKRIETVEEKGVGNSAFAKR